MPQRLVPPADLPRQPAAPSCPGCGAPADPAGCAWCGRGGESCVVNNPTSKNAVSWAGVGVKNLCRDSVHDRPGSQIFARWKKYREV